MLTLLCENKQTSKNSIQEKVGVSSKGGGKGGTNLLAERWGQNTKIPSDESDSQPRALRLMARSFRGTQNKDRWTQAHLVTSKLLHDISKLAVPVL